MVMNEKGTESTFPVQKNWEGKPFSQLTVGFTALALLCLYAEENTHKISALRELVVMAAKWGWPSAFVTISSRSSC
jgi:uncharacterized integral membrane protein